MSTYHSAVGVPSLFTNDGAALKIYCICNYHRKPAIQETRSNKSCLCSSTRTRQHVRERFNPPNCADSRWRRSWLLMMQWPPRPEAGYDSGIVQHCWLYLGTVQRAWPISLPQTNCQSGPVLYLAACQTRVHCDLKNGKKTRIKKTTIPLKLFGEHNKDQRLIWSWCM